MNSAALSSAIASALARLTPPPELLVSEWADEYRYLSSEASAEPGRWRTARAPYQKEILDSLSDPKVHTTVVQAASQVGKTEIALTFLGYHIHQDPGSILVLMPTVESAQGWSKERLAPMIRDTPVLRERVSDPKGRDSGNTVAKKEFPGGYVALVGANSPTGLASRPIRILIADECDRFPPSAGSEGDPLKLAMRRTATYWNSRRLIVSTPTIAGLSKIEALMNQSDRRRYWCPCPHCEEMQILQWSGVQWPEGRPEEAAYYCEHCGGEITDADKLWMLNRGEWRAEGESRGIAGFHLPEIYSPWRSFGTLAADFLEAKKGGPETLKVFVNTSLAETWEESGETVEHAPLYHRREQWEVLPQGVCLVTAGADVQKDRVEVSVIGWGIGEESWVICHKQLFGDPAQLTVWRDLDQFLLQQFEHTAGVQMGITSCCIDSGGHFSSEVYAFCKTRYARRIFACRGVGGEGKVFVARPTRSNQGRVALVNIGVDTGKDSLYGRLQITEEGPGYVHFHTSLDPEFFEQLTAETIRVRYHKGRPTRVWEKTRSRNEGLDCFIYGMAARHLLNVNFEAIAASLQPKPKGTPPPPQQSPRRPGNWITSGRTGNSGFATSWRR